jgi:carboxypeptidase Q
MRRSGSRSLFPASPGTLPRWLAVSGLLVLFAAASLAGAQTPTAPARTEADRAAAAALDHKVMELAKHDSEIMANLTYLSDIIGPRLTGSAALERASQWTAQKMTSYGLSNVHLEAWSIPAGWERGTATARIIEPDNGRSLILAAMGWTPGTKGRIEGDVVVLTARTSKELAAYKGKLKNAIVLRGKPADVRPITDLSFFPTRGQGRPPRPATPPAANPNANGKPEAAKTPDAGATPPARTDTPPRRDYRGSPDFRQRMAFQRELADFLRSEGAAVLFQDAGKPHDLLTMTGTWRGTDRASAPESLPTAFVAHEHYALLYRLASRPAPARTRVAVEITNRLIPGPIVVHNTVGEIRGCEKPDEYVILGAHLDSWDLAQGTTDNGTGSSVVLEAARILAKSGMQPRRTIRFVLFTGEEEGLHGSRAYVRDHKNELPRVSMCLVHDTGTGKVTGIGLQGRPVLKPILDAELASLREVGFKETDLRSMGGSDHASFEQAGVPGFAVEQDWGEYRLTHHSQSDTLDKAHEADLIQGAQVMAVAALRVANLPQLLPRDKPARERSRERPAEPAPKPPEKKGQPR